MAGPAQRLVEPKPIRGVKHRLQVIRRFLVLPLVLIIPPVPQPPAPPPPPPPPLLPRVREPGDPWRVGGGGGGLGRLVNVVRLPAQNPQAEPQPEAKTRSSSGLCSRRRVVERVAGAAAAIVVVAVGVGHGAG